MNEMDLEIALAEAEDVVAGKSRSHVRAAANMAPAVLELHRRLEIALHVADELRAAYRRVDPAGHRGEPAGHRGETRLREEVIALKRKLQRCPSSDLSLDILDELDAMLEGDC